ncbi:hypothetical protein LZ198_42085 [Myxococcus sp. K15C18031901]|uniref:hypothetical protein n=1 Tax=Myxococcus dinghuensis TaxID=2906761 RepID=UPI0020A6ED1E|nr:hypothetical protein [Myxococcus dinghuensis]MCP3105471.1 hypothetical protein [Myxococcus dinghuensis]
MSVDDTATPFTEEYVVARIIDPPRDGTLMAGTKTSLEQCLQMQRARLKRRREELPAELAKASASVARNVRER